MGRSRASSGSFRALARAASGIILPLTEVQGLPTVRVESPARVAHALAWFDQGMDFADALHLAACADGGEFATFDRTLVTAARKAKAGKLRAL